MLSTSFCASFAFNTDINTLNNKQLTQFNQINNKTTNLCDFEVSLSQKSCSIKELDICLTNYFFEQKGIPTNDLQLLIDC